MGSRSQRSIFRRRRLPPEQSTTTAPGPTIQQFSQRRQDPLRHEKHHPEQDRTEDGQVDLGSSERANQPILERRSEEHTSELQSRLHLVCRLLLEKNTL